MAPTPHLAPVLSQLVPRHTLLVASRLLVQPASSLTSSSNKTSCTYPSALHGEDGLELDEALYSDSDESIEQVLI
jgi:hypothetical protein